MLSEKEGKISLLEVNGIKKYFPVEKNYFLSGMGGTGGGKDGFVRAVDGVSFKISKGETLALVGESGCGKSTLARLILRLIEPDSGEIYFNGRELLGMDKNKLGQLRKSMQIIFQNPYASLNPRLTIKYVITEIMRVHGIPDNQIGGRIESLLGMVGMDAKDLDRYPHEFSGGQCQRIGIMRALAVSPEFIVADEPISALDVSIQAQIINLLLDLQKKLFLTYLFIAHDLAIVRYISNRVAVMYMGQIVEVSPTSELYEKPLHPYTKLLLSSIPGTSKKYEEGKPEQGFIAENSNCPNIFEGCKFKTRCKYSTEECSGSLPELREAGQGHFVRCFLNT